MADYRGTLPHHRKAYISQGKCIRDIPQRYSDKNGILRLYILVTAHWHKAKNNLTLLYVHVCVCFSLCCVFWTAEPRRIICEPDTNCNVLPLLVIIKVRGNPYKNTFSKVMILCSTPNL